MLGRHGIQPVSVAFNSARSCFLHLPASLVAQLRLRENQILELSWPGRPPLFLSWTRSLHAPQDGRVELSRQFGERLGLREGEQGFLRPCEQVRSVHRVFVEPLSSDDWEILELHSTQVEQRLLDQVRAVFPGAVFPVWVEQRTFVYIRIASLSPVVPYGRLEQFTELVISPKVRPGAEERAPPALSGKASLNQPLHRKESSDEPTSATPSVASGPQNESLRGQLNASQSHPSRQWCGIGDLKGLARLMFPGMVEPVKDLPLVPGIPQVFKDSIFRVCGDPPHSASHHCTLQSEVHLLPWAHWEVNSLGGGQPALTYGLISKVPSPKEMREKAKRAMEKKKKTGDASKDPDEQDMESVVVRVKCHIVEKHKGVQIHRRMGDVHSGRVWITDVLRANLKIDLHSAVQLKPIQSTPRVALEVRLQPLRPEDQAASEEEVRTAFAGWLHSLSHEPLACLAGRSGSILLAVGEGEPAAPLPGRSGYALTVLRPPAGERPAEELFLLTTSVLQKSSVQVVKEPLGSRSSNDVRGPDKNHEDLPNLSALGGVTETSELAFSHIRTSLMASPLGCVLASTGVGLRGGAVLVTGATGSGKSSLSRALCRKAMDELDAHVEVVDCKKLKGKRGDTVRQKLEEVFEQAVWRQPSVVLLDDLDHVTGEATSAELEQGHEALLCQHIAQSLMDQVDGLVVRGSLVALIATSLSKHSLHRSLTKVQGSHFFQTFVHIPSPDQTQRVEILRSLVLSDSGVSRETLSNLDFEAVAKRTEGFLPQDLSLLLERAVHANVVNNKGLGSQGVCLMSGDFLQAQKGFTPPSMWGAKLQPPCGVGMDRVGGLKHVRQTLVDTILLPAKYPVLFSSLPIRHRSAVLLYGAPGTGKTLLAGAVAKESGMNFISIKGPELLSKYIGASEQAVRDVFQRAQAAKPCILFFDEFDSLAPRRGHDSTGVTDRVVNQLLTQLDGVEGVEGVYVLAATSRPDLIDPALLRPGRLDKSLYCPPPDQEARLDILKVFAQSVTLAEDVDLEQVAAATELFTGADLKALLYNAQLEAIHASVGPSLVPEAGSGSDSDASLSSMIFLNHSSGSDDSAGEGEGGLENSMVVLEPEDAQSNVWRLYFGSSYESELGNPSPSELNSRCLSGPSSTGHDLTGTSMRDPGVSLAPAFMPSVQRGYQELGAEQTERLQDEINNIKSNYRRPTEEAVLHAGPSKPTLSVSQAHLDAALASTRASIARQDWKRYVQLYESFGASRSGKVQSSAQLIPGQRVTLA
ncbi:peroxisomal ATPase PEX1 isoform X2 [Denticeps clupeoides]|uniref:Peroxisomal ATPase PEX1 n=1 Tax=Denticeps clupeoides TaxID=299321 RepID=A0AAY4EIK1_9TELE|nr:peroxisome biogenesis factor 1 isoform X2 [Denticeps clupeoides]